jgi:hypothetical protein
MDDLVKLCRERAAGYGALRRSCLTAIALDRSADRIEQLQRQLAEAGNQLGWAARRLPPSHREVVEKWAADAEAANIRERTD